MAVSLTSADKALKSLYLDVVAEQLNKEANPFLAMVKQSSDDVWGKEIRKCAIYGMNGGIGRCHLLLGYCVVIVVFFLFRAARSQ